MHQQAQQPSEMTQRQNKKMTRHNISSLIMTETCKNTSPCWLSSSCGSRNTVPLRCHWITTKFFFKKAPPKLKHFHERQRQFKGGTVFKSSTNTKSSISHCKMTDYWMKKQHFRYLFFFFNSCYDFSSLYYDALKVTFSCYSSDFSSSSSPSLSVPFSSWISE